LVPFDLRLGCLPAKGDRRFFFDRMARRVAILDGHDLPGHRSSLSMAGGSLV
jgi:hypothetical protein